MSEATTVENPGAVADTMWGILKALKAANVLKDLDDLVSEGVRNVAKPQSHEIGMLVATPSAMPTPSRTGVFVSIGDTPPTLRIFLSVDTVQNDLLGRFVTIHELLHGMLQIIRLNSGTLPFKDHDDNFSAKERELYRKLRKSEGKSDAEIDKELEKFPRNKDID